jgi:hypothetical protein
VWERQVQISRSSEVAYAITTAFAVLYNGHRGRRDAHFHEELEVAQVRFTRFLTPPRTDNLCWFARTLFWFRVCVSANGPLLEVEHASRDRQIPRFQLFQPIHQ